MNKKNERISRRIAGFDTKQLSIGDKRRWEKAKISVVFALPQNEKPLSVQCVPHRANCIGGEMNIGASFWIRYFACYQTIKNHLIN
jgi:hypothetical protein